jgi:hypothetical protein
MNIQTMLVLGALMIIGGITLVVNRTLSDTSDRVTEGSVTLSALNLAEKYVNDARERRFDEATVISATTSLTSVGSLGPDAGESTIAAYDDIDDFNNLNRVDSLDGNAYRVQMSVFYCSPANYDAVSATQTYTKHLIVRVKSPFLSQLPDSCVRLDYLATHQVIFDQQQSN